MLPLLGNLPNTPGNLRQCRGFLCLASGCVMSVSASQFLVAGLFAAIFIALFFGEMGGLRLKDRRLTGAIGVVCVGAILVATVVLASSS